MARYRTGQTFVGRHLSPQQLLRIGVRAAEKRMSGKRPSETTFRAGENAAFDAIRIADPQAGTSTHKYRAARYSHGVARIAHRATQLARRLLWVPSSQRPAWETRLSSRDRSKFMTKPGKHGTLTRFAITYIDPRDEGFGRDVWRTWAYDRAHAVDNFYDSEDGDGGWKILDVEKVRDRS